MDIACMILPRNFLKDKAKVQAIFLRWQLFCFIAIFQARDLLDCAIGCSKNPK